MTQDSKIVIKLTHSGHYPDYYVWVTAEEYALIAGYKPFLTEYVLKRMDASQEVIDLAVTLQTDKSRRTSFDAPESFIVYE